MNFQTGELELPQSLVPDLVEAFCDSWRQVKESMGQEARQVKDSKGQRVRQMKESMGQEVRQKNSSKGQQQVVLESLEVTNRGNRLEDLAQPRRSSRVRESREGFGENRGQSLAFVSADRLRLPQVVEDDDRGRGERRERRERRKVERLQFERLEEERLEDERHKIERQMEERQKVGREREERLRREKLIREVSVTWPAEKPERQRQDRVKFLKNETRPAQDRLTYKHVWLNI